MCENLAKEHFKIQQRWPRWPISGDTHAAFVKKDTQDKQKY